MITDGTSKTLSLAETRETPQSTWIDGSRDWITAATGQGTFNSTLPHMDGQVGQVNSEIDTNPYFSLYPRADRESVAEAP